MLFCVCLKTKIDAFKNAKQELVWKKKEKKYLEKKFIALNEEPAQKQDTAEHPLNAPH